MLFLIYYIHLQPNYIQNESKGFGFITNDETEQDIFVHVTALNGLTIQEGDKVNYTEGEGRKGKAAIDISIV